MVIYMKICWIKQEEDDGSFILFEKIGMNVVRINEPDQIDKKINELIESKYNTIVLSSELAGFSEDIIKKYNKNDDIHIIIGKRN